MELLLEFLFELLFEVPFDAAMESKRLKTWVKTTLFIILGGAVVLLFAVITVSTACDGNISGAVAAGAVTLALLAMVIFGAIFGHKRNWKQKF